MRFKSKAVDNYVIYAVAGTHTVSFAIDFKNANTEGLLGFSVKRTYPDSNEEHYMPGFKIFQNEKISSPNTEVSTENNPIQSFVWDDFTIDPNKEYTYSFIPVKGKPDNLLKGKPISIKIKTEALFGNNQHDIFFNRGAASSQAYAREFNNISPDKLVGKKQQEAFDWLARGLDTAIYTFIKQAKAGETLLGCFYEFQYVPVLKAFKDAIDRGVNVTLIIDMKNNEHTVKGKLIPSSPRVDNIQAIKEARIPMKNIIYREANKNKIQHNKFIVYLKGKTKIPTSVFSGSTNITESGIFGQTNVGHWIRDASLAVKYKEYWDLLSKDPGAKDKDDNATKKENETAYIKEVMAIQSDVTKNIPIGVIPMFSPRNNLNMLNTYFDLIDKAKNSSVITLAFGITADLKTMLSKHTSESPITFIMLDKADKPNKRSTKKFYSLNVKENVYEAFGSNIVDPVYNWVKEINSEIVGSKFVKYIHSKFLIQDPLGNNPIVITGSANFSPDSTTGNDENMIIICGNTRVADIYFTEFNRLFNHYYFRSVIIELKNSKIKENKKSYYLFDTDEWINNYKSGTLRNKRVEMFLNMTGASIIPL